MSPEERESYIAKLRAAQPAGLVIDRRITKRTPFTKGHPPMHKPEGIERMRRTQRGLPSVKRHLADIARDHPELIRNALLRELEGPRAPQILLLFASYLDGRPGDGDSRGSRSGYDPKLAAMSAEELAAEAEKLAAQLRAMADDEQERQTVIDVTATAVEQTDDDEVLL